MNYNKITLWNIFTT